MEQSNFSVASCFFLGKRILLDISYSVNCMEILIFFILFRKVFIV